MIQKDICSTVQYCVCGEREGCLVTLCREEHQKETNPSEAGKKESSETSVDFSTGNDDPRGKDPRAVLCAAQN